MPLAPNGRGEAAARGPTLLREKDMGSDSCHPSEAGSGADASAAGRSVAGGRWPAGNAASGQARDRGRPGLTTSASILPHVFCPQKVRPFVSSHAHWGRRNWHALCSKER